MNNFDKERAIKLIKEIGSNNIIMVYHNRFDNNPFFNEESFYLQQALNIITKLHVKIIKHLFKLKDYANIINNIDELMDMIKNRISFITNEQKEPWFVFFDIVRKPRLIEKAKEYIIKAKAFADKELLYSLHSPGDDRALMQIKLKVLYMKISHICIQLEKSYFAYKDKVDL